MRPPVLPVRRMCLATALALVLPGLGLAAGPPKNMASRTSRMPDPSLDTLAWVGTGAVTAADLVRRIEWMPWSEKKRAAGMDSAKVRALQSLAGEELLAQEAEREGIGDSGSVGRMRASLRKALVRDALFRDVVAGTPAASAAEVDRIVRHRALRATPEARRALRRAVADSLRGLGVLRRASAFMAGVLGGQRAVVDSATFMLLADSLRSLMARSPPPAVHAGSHPLLPEYVEALLAAPGPDLERPLVLLPGDPLRLGEALEAMRFYAFSLRSLEPRPFAAELSARLRTVVEGELMAREGLRRGLDRRPDVRRDLEMWTTAWRAQLLLQRVSSGPEAGDDVAFRRLALADPEAAVRACEVDVAEILSGSESQAVRLRSLLDAGASFDSLARLYTVREEWREQGGHSGYFKVAHRPDLGYAALLTPAGPLCGPLRLPEGYTVFRVLGKRLDPDSLAARGLLEAARAEATAELRGERAARYVAALAEQARVKFDYAALRGVDVLQADMLTKRFLGFGGGMLAFPSLPRLWDWVRIWYGAHPKLP